MGSPAVNRFGGRGSRWLVVAVVALVVIVVGVVVGGSFLLRPAAHATLDGISVDCSANTGLNDAECAALGGAILARGPGATVFEVEDVVRIVIDRPLLGGDGKCSLDWYIGRYRDRPALSEQTDCQLGPS